MNVLAVAIDCHRPAVLARFWAEALGGGRIERWTDSVGLTYVQVHFAGHPELLSQPVPEPKAVKNRVHLDLCVLPPRAGQGRQTSGSVSDSA